ncbi:MAG: DCC1-like thiol-disulfide oxidoreductase family protein [Planctomycetota bacterium]
MDPAPPVDPGALGASPDPDVGGGPVLFYDGECGLCARSVRFVLDHERDDTLRFAPLQSELGRAVAARAGLDPDTPSTLVLLGADGEIAKKSTAALRLARHLRMPWRLVRVGLVVPPFLRNAVYDFIAKRRMKWFGGAESCALPTRAELARMLG